MRAPQDMPPRAPRALGGNHRRRWWIVAVVAVLIILLASLKSLATLYTDSFWFSSVHLHRVWSTLLAIKVGLFASFGAVFFVVLWVNLLICDRFGSSAPALDPDDELVRRYHQTVSPYAGRVHAAVAVVFALIAASGTVGEWNNWILFTHGGNFAAKDPEFGMNVGFYVFKLPFLEFLVNWTLVVLVVILVVTTAFHYLNGGIRAQRNGPRVRPAVKVHLSVLLALVALVKAAGYILQRYQLATSTNGYVEGPGYSDVHARVPALELLFFVSLLAAAILLYNIRRRGWTLPVLAVGVWAFVALVVGVIYPAVLQALKVTPAQSTLEKPYIQHNIQATRTAYGLDKVKITSFQGKTTLSSNSVTANTTTLANIRLWDPDRAISLPTFQKLQGLKTYYTFQSVGVDRYKVNGKLTPTVVGVRQINPQDLPSSGWVNTHLEYTHGEGLALAAANEATPHGNPDYAIKDVPPTSNKGLPKITQPGVYFGLTDPGYVVADSRQPELDYQKSNGTDVNTHYAGTGGVKLNNFLTKAAFALRMGDLNLLISNLITPQSKIMFVRTIVAMAQKAAPFLSFDSDPYAALVDGHIDWIMNAYTTTAEYPYSQTASTQQVPPGSGLPANYNYVRNSVVLAINAYSGKMTFYAMDNDPILQAYESAFPNMFTPKSKMTSTLTAHLRYPEDMFSIQSAIYGRYHITSASNFYTAGDAWTVSPTAGAGSSTTALAVAQTVNSQGIVTSTRLQPMSPLYQVLQEPGEKGQSFTISDAYVPAQQGPSSQVLVLSAFLMGDSDPGQFGQLRVYETTPGSSVAGPAQAESYIEQNTAVSKAISLLDQRRSQVLLGNILMVPVEQSMIYVRPLYIESSGNPQPQLRDVIAVLGTKVEMKPTLDQALTALLHTPLGTGSAAPTAKPTPKPRATTTTVQQADADLVQAAADYTKAKADLKTGTLGGYATENADAAQEEAAAAALLKTSGTATGTTTTTAPKTQSKNTAPKSGTTTTTAEGSKSGSTSTTTSTTPNEA